MRCDARASEAMRGEGERGGEASKAKQGEARPPPMPPPMLTNKLFKFHVRATSENGGVATPYGTRVKRGAYAGPALWG